MIKDIIIAIFMSIFYILIISVCIFRNEIFKLLKISFKEKNKEDLPIKETEIEETEEYKIPTFEYKPINPINMKKIKKFATRVLKYNQIIGGNNEFTYTHIS